MPASLSPEEHQHRRAQSAIWQRRWARWRTTARSLSFSLGGGIILVLIGYALPKSAAEPWQTLVDLAVVALFSAFVAYGELVSRYHDSPVRLVSAPPTPIYLLINIAAGVAALLIVNKLGATAGTKAPRLYAILLAGFGSMAFFRTSLFTLRVGDSDIGIGPAQCCNRCWPLRTE